jgi:hypothetical protein
VVVGQANDQEDNRFCIALRRVRDAYAARQSRALANDEAAKRNPKWPPWITKQEFSEGRRRYRNGFGVAR